MRAQLDVALQGLFSQRQLRMKDSLLMRYFNFVYCSQGRDKRDGIGRGEGTIESLIVAKRSDVRIKTKMDSYHIFVHVLVTIVSVSTSKQ